MINKVIVVEDSPEALHSIELLTKSVNYIRSLHEVEASHDYRIEELVARGSKFFVGYYDLRCVRKNIGCAAYICLDGTTVELKHMFVDSEARGFGCGKALLQCVERTAFNNKIKKIVLETSEQLVEAISLYRKFGYVECEPYVNDYHGHDVFMQKLLISDS